MYFIVESSWLRLNIKSSSLNKYEWSYVIHSIIGVKRNPYFLRYYGVIDGTIPPIALKALIVLNILSHVIGVVVFFMLVDYQLFPLRGGLFFVGFSKFQIFALPLSHPSNNLHIFFPTRDRGGGGLCTFFGVVGIGRFGFWSSLIPVGFVPFSCCKLLGPLSLLFFHFCPWTVLCIAEILSGHGDLLELAKSWHIWNQRLVYFPLVYSMVA